MLQEVFLSPGKLLSLPLMDGHRLGSGRQVVPEVLHQLELFGRGKIENGGNGRVHEIGSGNCNLKSSYFPKCGRVNRISPSSWLIGCPSWAMSWRVNSCGSAAARLGSDFL